MVFVKSIWKLQELQQEHNAKIIFLFFILVFGSKILLYLLNSLFPFFNPSISFYRQCCDNGKLSNYMKYESMIGVAFFITTVLATALGFSSIDLVLEAGFFVFCFDFLGFH